MKKVNILFYLMFLISSFLCAQRGTKNSKQISTSNNENTIKQSNSNQKQPSLFEVLDAINNNKTLPSSLSSSKKNDKGSSYHTSFNKNNKMNVSSKKNYKNDTIFNTSIVKKNSAEETNISTTKDNKLNKSTHQINSITLFNKNYNELNDVEKIQLKAKQLEYDKQKK